MAQEKTSQQLPQLDTDEGGSDGSDNDYKDDDPISTSAPPPILQKDEVQSAFEEIIKKAKGGKLNLGNKKNRNDFLLEYGDLISKKTQADDQTLFHLVANEVGHKSLIRCVTKNYKNLLEQKDRSGRYPLHIAIARNNYDFLFVVSEVIKDLDRLLSLRGEHSRNCLHMALTYGLDQSSTIDMIKRASEATLCAGDKDGLTPLHLAVEYDRSSSAGLNIVQELLTYGDAALDKFTTISTKLSVYEYHQHTRAQAEKRLTEKKSSSAAEKSQEESTKMTQDRKKISVKGRGGSELPSESGYDIGLDKSGGSLQSRQQSKTLLVRMGSFTNGNVPSPILREDNKSTKESEFIANSTGPEGKGLERRMAAPPSKGDSRDDLNPLRLHEGDSLKAKYASEIRQLLKLCYMRTTFRTDKTRSLRDQYGAERFLHGANLGSPTTVRKDSFKQSYDHMIFDEVLRYVSFRRVELQKPLSLERESRFSKKLTQLSKPERGRNDLPFFFDWIYKKGVKHILKLIVDDLNEPSHSDRSLEDSLKPFKIDILDWRKLDICPETIFIACRSVKEIYLQWSGNRAILRAWGEPDGLPRLPNLEKVHLVWNAEKVLESADRIESYVKNFQDRLEEAVKSTTSTQEEGQKAEIPIATQINKSTRRKISVYRSEMNVQTTEKNIWSGGSSELQGNINEKNSFSNRWLDSMDKFSDEIQNVAVPNTSDWTLRDEIKVALIDDGVDPYVESLRGKICGGFSFDRGYPHDLGPSPYYTSSKGHGTVMADMICRVFPMAKLYVYKLETQSSINAAKQIQSHDQISVESAASAVTAAKNQRVDVISMSWTVKETEDNGEGIRKLRDAITAALDAKILLFCAAADTGAVLETEYPWTYDARRIFRIGAATADGRVWGPTGNPQQLSFIFPGHNVVSRNPHREGALWDDFKERTGSSIATALAAGLAALILHCVRLGAIHTQRETESGRTSSTAVEATELELLKTHKGMSYVLKRIGLDEGQHVFIQVWKQFDGPARSLKNSHGKDSDKLAVIAKLARDLVSGISSLSD